MLEGAAWRAEQTVRVASIAGWMTAALSRQEQLPTLSKLLGEEPSGGAPQPVEEQAAIIRMLHARLGGTLTSGEPLPVAARVKATR